MSFLTKYREYFLDDADLIGWYRFPSSSADLDDSGPNANNMTGITGSTSSGSNGLSYNNGMTSVQVPAPESFTAIFCLERTLNANPTVFFSNSSYPVTNSSQEQRGFFFGLTRNGHYFLNVSSVSGSFFKVFKTLPPSDKCIFAIQREANLFTVSVYSPISGDFSSEAVSVPTQIGLGSWDLKLGAFSHSLSAVFGPAYFLIRECAIFLNGVPSFVLKDFCNEFFLTTGSVRTKFLDNYISVKKKGVLSQLRQVSFNTGKDTGISLPYSEISEGFSLLENIPDVNRGYYRNGIAVSPVSEDLFVAFSGQSPSDIVIMDNFPSGVTSGSLTTFYGQSNGLFPHNKPTIFQSGLRVNTDYATVGGLSLLSGKVFNFPENPNLIEI